MVLRHPTLAAKTITRRGWGTQTLYLKEKCFSGSLAGHGGRLEKMHLRIIVRRRGKIICKQLGLLQTLTPLTLHFEFCKCLPGLAFGIRECTTPQPSASRLASAWRTRARQTSRPSTAMVSNSGGAFLRPHTGSQATALRAGMAWATKRTPSAAQTRLIVSKRGALLGRRAL